MKLCTRKDLMKFKYDGKSRPTNQVYAKRWGEIFGKDQEKFDKLQQEQRDLEESYQQSKRNKQEREDNEEYLKEIKDKL